MTKKSVKDIKYRSPCKIPETEMYSNDPKLPENLELEISRRIRRLQKDGVDLAVHSQYLESVVDEQISKYLRNLEAKYLKRVDLINRIFMKRKADKEDFQKYLMDIEIELSSTKEEFKTVSAVYEKYNPLYNEKTWGDRKETDDE